MIFTVIHVYNKTQIKEKGNTLALYLETCLLSSHTNYN